MPQVVSINSDDNDTSPHANCHRIATREIANDSQTHTQFLTPATYKEVHRTLSYACSQKGKRMTTERYLKRQEIYRGNN